VITLNILEGTKKAFTELLHKML